MERNQHDAVGLFQSPCPVTTVIRNFRNQLVILLAIAGLAIAAGANGQGTNLPDLGSPADAILSKSQEAQIGRAIMRQIQASGMLVEDPQITEYVNEIGHRIAAHAHDGDHKIHFFCSE